MIKIRPSALNKDDFRVAVPVVSWQEMAEVQKRLVEYLTILGDEIEATELMEIEGKYWFIIWLKRRPGLFKAIEVSITTTLRELRKRKMSAALTRKIYHPQIKTFLIPSLNKEEGLKLRKALVEYIEEKLWQEWVIVSEVDERGMIEVSCPTDKAIRLISPLLYCFSRKRGFLKAVL